MTYVTCASDCICEPVNARATWRRPWRSFVLFSFCQVSEICVPQHLCPLNCPSIKSVSLHTTRAAPQVEVDPNSDVEFDLKAEKVPLKTDDDVVKRWVISSSSLFPLVDVLISSFREER